MYRARVSTVRLLERAESLATLRDEFDAVRRSGSGRTVIVTGEAGAGKSSLVRYFVDIARSVRPAPTFARCGCDELRIPRPLGPVLDLRVVPTVGDPPGADPGTPHTVAVAADLLQQWSRSLTVVVVEDVHWTDESTADALSYIGRRIHQTSALLVVTARNDAAGTNAAAAVLLGDLAAAGARRIELRPLSSAAVETLVDDADLAGRPGERRVRVDPHELHQLTGGNAFFVTECLASAGGSVPSTVEDAVIGRRARLSSSAQQVVDAFSVVPGGADLDLLRRLVGDDVPGLDEAIRSGMLVELDGEHASPRIAFRHELARRVVESALGPVARCAAHRRAFEALGDVAAPDHARLAHHAAGAGHVHGLIEHAGRAADVARAAGARREECAHLDSLTPFETRLDTATRGEVWMRLGGLRLDLGDLDGSVEAFERAIELATADGDVERQCLGLVRIGSALSARGSQGDATRCVDRALELLVETTTGAAPVLVHGARCADLMLERRLSDAVEWGERARAMIDDQTDERIRFNVLLNLGAARMMRDDDTGLDQLVDLVGSMRAQGRNDPVTYGMLMIGSGAGELRRYDIATTALEEAIELADQLDLLVDALYGRAWLSRCRFELGEMEVAARLAAAVLRSPRCAGISEQLACTVLARIRTRRGDPGAFELLERALTIAEESGHLQRRWPVVVARVEAAVIDDDPERELPLLRAVHAQAVGLESVWAVDELSYWRWVLGDLEPSAIGEPRTPFALEICGRDEEASAAWRALGCPYEAVLARTGSRILRQDSDDGAAAAHESEPLTDAILELRSLGAVRVADRAAVRARRSGWAIPRGPRGPNRATRANPAGLTDREIDVLELVAAGATNREIGAALGISPKTVGHHVSHVLTKLGARSRSQAVAAAAGAGILPVAAP